MKPAGEGGALGFFSGHIHMPCSSALVRTWLGCAVHAEGLQSFIDGSSRLDGLILPRIEISKRPNPSYFKVHESIK